MDNKVTATELLELLIEKVETNNVKDSVHKIKIMTAIDVIKEMIR
ncbi:hypothetical protein N9L64_01025 [Flavobacteriaceae bacterium]|jgi:hypothetical protein|nr:hypothetical protein [Flavobacteriaceae bacterium]